MIRALNQSTATINLLRTLASGGYVDLHRIHDINLQFVNGTPQGKSFFDYANHISNAMAFMQSCGLPVSPDLSAIGCSATSLREPFPPPFSPPPRPLSFISLPFLCSLLIVSLCIEPDRTGTEFHPYLTRFFEIFFDCSLESVDGLASSAPGRILRLPRIPTPSIRGGHDSLR